MEYLNLLLTNYILKKRKNPVTKFILFCIIMVLLNIMVNFTNKGNVIIKYY